MMGSDQTPREKRRTLENLIKIYIPGKEIVSRETYVLNGHWYFELESNVVLKADLVSKLMYLKLLF